MKVFVTGGCGFIGSHICEYYARKGDEVVSYDNMTKHELQRTGYATDAARDYNWNYLKDLGVKMIKADIRDKEELIESASGCDFIAHTAAQPAVTISIESPEFDFTNNVLGTFNVLEAARAHGIPVASCATIHVYGNLINETLTEGKTRFEREPAEIDETHPTVEGNLTPLHASKRSAELYLQAYIDSYGLKAASFRLTGLYGPRQLGGEDHGWVANFAIRTVLGEPIRIFGTGKQVRDILYATDVATAFDAFYRAKRPGIYNIGGGSQNSISLLECVALIERITGKKPEVNFEEERFGDLKYFICDTSKVRSELDWASTVLPEDGVSMLLEWIGSNMELFRAGGG